MPSCRIAAGHWRGIQISKGFVTGEVGMLFDGALATVSITGPGVTGTANTSFLVPAPPALPELWMLFTSGPDAGKARKALFKCGPDGPETNGPPRPPSAACAPCPPCAPCRTRGRAACACP